MLWTGQFAANLGGQLTGFALPAAVVLGLRATPMQVGSLQAVTFGVIPLLAMFAGVLVDRYPRRPLMIAANGVRAAALVTLPLAFALHHLTLQLVFTVAVVCGIAAVVYDTAFAAFVALIVPREHAAAANARLSIGSSSAEAVGASLAGVAIGVFGAPLALFCDAIANVVTTILLLRIRHRESNVRPLPPTVAGLWGELAAGARALVRDPVLRTVGLTNATSHFGGAVVTSVFAIYVYRDLHFSALVLGLILGCANLGIGGAFFAERIARRLGVRCTLAVAIATAGAANLLLPLCAPAAPLAAVIAMRLLLTLCGPIVEVNAQTLRVVRVPSELMGRVSAANRTLVWGALPLGALAGGCLASALGVVPTLEAGGAIALAAAAWMLGCPALALSGCADARVEVHCAA